MLPLPLMSESADNEKKAKDWCVYMVRCADNTLYTGISTDVDARVSTHNKGRGAKYTRARLPVTLVFTETANNRSHAQQREHAIKKLSVANKNALINAHLG